jgi:hypothetical protein
LLAFLVVEDSGGAVHPPAGLGVLEDPASLVRLDLDALETGQREQQRVACLSQQTADERGRGLVAEGEDDGGVVALGWFALGLEREPQHRHLPVPPAYFGVQPR